MALKLFDIDQLFAFLIMFRFMKIPKRKIFWQHIASPYLNLADLTCFETAVCNHLDRRRLMLPMPMETDTIIIDDEDTDILPELCNPYESLFQLNTNVWTELESDEMRIWCENRRLVVQRVQLSFIPQLDRNEAIHPWDMLHYITDLYVEDLEEPLVIRKKFFGKLLSLRSFTCMSESLVEGELVSLVKQANANVVRSDDHIPGPCQLEKLTLHLAEIGPKTLKYLIGNLSALTSILFAHAECIKDDMIELMALRWTSLNSIDIIDTRLSDKGLETFRKTPQKFQYVRLMGVEEITANGIRSLLSNSGNSLLELKLSCVDLSDKDVASLLQLCPRLKGLTLDAIPDCSGTIIRVISKRCPNLTQLKLEDLYDSDKVRDSDIQLFVNGCKKIAKLHLTGFTSITPKAVDMIDQAYAMTLTKFWLNDKKMLQRLRRTQFSSCRHRLVVDREEEEFFDIE